MSVVDTVEILKGHQLSDDEYLKAGVLGWAIEIVRWVISIKEFNLHPDGLASSLLPRCR